VGRAPVRVALAAELSGSFMGHIADGRSELGAPCFDLNALQSKSVRRFQIFNEPSERFEGKRASQLDMWIERTEHDGIGAGSWISRKRSDSSRTW